MKAAGRIILRFTSSAGLLIGGCATVDPTDDYQRAADQIQERTGINEVYSPAADHAVEDRVAALLIDGLTVDEAVTLGLLNNRGLQAGFYDIGVSRAEVVQSRLLTNPELSIAGMLPEGGGRSNLQLSLAQQIVDLWQIPVRKQIAEADLEATILRIARQAVVLAAQIRGEAYQVLMLRRLEASALENVQLVEQSEVLARRRFDAGDTGLLDVNLARSRTISARVELLQASRERQLAETTLANTLNLSDPGRTVDLIGELPPLKAYPPATDLFTLALRQRLDIRSADLSVQAAEARISLESLKLFPSVTVGLNLERLEARAQSGRNIVADTVRDSIAAGQLTAPSIQSAGQREQEQRSQIDAMLGPSLGVTLPIWDQNQAQIAIARNRLTQAYKQYEFLLNDVANQVTQASIVLSNAGEIVAFYRDQGLPQATAALEIASSLYEAGEQGIVAVIQAQETLVTQRQAYVRILGDYARALAELEQAVGGSLPAGMATSRPAASRAAN